MIVYGIGILSEEERREAKRAERALTELAVATGGEAFFPKDVYEVERIAQTVARDIRSQYTIQYTPDEPGHGRLVPADQGRDQCARPADGAHPQRLLRHAKRAFSSTTKPDYRSRCSACSGGLTRGYRLRPWRSPYLRWRIETYWGLHADRSDSASSGRSSGGSGGS